MQIYFINPPFKAEYGRFSRESRSPAITKSGAIYYPLWLIYAAAYAEKNGHEVAFLDAPAKGLDEARALDIIQTRARAQEKCLFVLDTSTPSIKSDAAFGARLKERFPGSFVLLVGTHPSACPEETLQLSDGITWFDKRREFCKNTVWLKNGCALVPQHAHHVQGKVGQSQDILFETRRRRELLLPRTRPADNGHAL